GLLQMDAANAVPILKRVLARRDACSAGMRRKAVFLLSQKRTGETEDILLDVAQHDPDSEVRQQAVFWLSQVPTERAVGMLDSILKTTSDEELQDKAIFALSQQRNPRAGEILRAYADRPGAPAKARLKAIFWLGQRPSPENAAFLRALYSKLAEPDLKENVIFSLSQLHGEENLRRMMDIALNEREDIEMRKKALFWAAIRRQSRSARGAVRPPAEPGDEGAARLRLLAAAGARRARQEIGRASCRERGEITGGEGAGEIEVERDEATEERVTRRTRRRSQR